MAIEEGKAAPPFSLQDADEKTVRLSDLKGRHVVLYFYPKDDTPGCTREACGFRDAWSDLKAAGVAVLGVSRDGAASHRKFAGKYSLPFALLSDPDHAVMERYGAWGEKVMYGKRTEGVVRSTVWIGPDGKVRRHWKRVSKPEDHAREVLEAIRAGGE